MPRVARVPSARYFFSICGMNSFTQEIFIAHFAVFGVDIEGVTGAGRKNDEVADLALAAQFGDDVPPTGVQQRLLVVAESVQVIEHRIMARLVLIEARAAETRSSAPAGRESAT